jgi:hypothetical protein
MELHRRRLRLPDEMQGQFSQRLRLPDEMQGQFSQMDENIKTFFSLTDGIGR